MPAPEVIALESNGSLKFGGYSTAEKIKSNDFDVGGDIYKVKTHSEITRAEKNGKLLFESIPGTSVNKFILSEKQCAFTIEGFENTQITIELEPDTEYKLIIDGTDVGRSKSNRSSKFSFSVDLHDAPKDIVIERI